LAGKADDCVDVSVIEQFLADAGFCATSEQDTMRQDDGHHAFVL